jgi:hypothetical protein
MASIKMSEMHDTLQKIDGIAHEIKDHMNEAIKREEYTWDDTEKKYNIALFGVEDVILSRPRLKPDYSEKLLEFVSLRFEIVLRNQDGRVTIVMDENAPGVWSSGDDKVYVKYECFAEQKFKEFLHLYNRNTFKYKTWNDFLNDVTRVAKHIESTRDYYQTAIEDVKKVAKGGTAC